MIVPISGATSDYASSIRDKIRSAKFHVDVDLSSATMQKKVRTAQLAQYNYIFVVGEQEKENGTVNVRTRDNAVHGMHKVEDIIGILAEEKNKRSLVSIFKKDDAEVPNGVDSKESSTTKAV